MDIQKVFSSLSLNDINNFIRNSQEENLYLDFKTINRPDISHRDDKKNLAIALSGFANSSGGLIIWGVDARKNSDGVDCASGLKEIDSLPLFVSRLNQLTGEAVSPLVEGVEHRGISSVGSEGFAASLVPSSDSGPHMAKLGEDRYYKRSGDSFYRMEHFDLEDMFGRRPRVKLSFRWKFVRGRTLKSSGVTQYRVHVMCSLENMGRASAKAPFLGLILSAPFVLDEYGIDGNRNFGLERLVGARGTNEVLFGASAGPIIHPGLQLDIAAVSVDLAKDQPNLPDIKIKYRIGAEGMPLVHDEVVISSQELREFLNSLA